MIQFRAARMSDAAAMTDVQNAIYRAGLRSSPVDLERVRERYLEYPGLLACTVAEQDGRVVGFQVLIRAGAVNDYGLPEGWGIIGTHVHPEMGRSGIGRRLFASSLEAARTAGVRHIDASIGRDNAPALAYYAALGFRPYREGDSTIPHRYDVDADSSV